MISCQNKYGKDCVGIDLNAIPNGEPTCAAMNNWQKKIENNMEVARLTMCVHPSQNNL